ncbi:tRNA cytosine34-C5-methyltransferase [Hondaea fermentalgiana]|uniref:tRNA cytosine34-C5-methyltransferase n=1 Tax=Hondaea fermentalgiana TaxID=2315210 RepID=A0A2R5GBL5_9STRA|nr:tRNA cytosine34-C5-methyltransferase [Hondaea fermentalgiana]|eukprot:GBG27975.1 tRNA cytosine34-C5-methyltransferase [Hondaea fermentalgiana]
MGRHLKGKRRARRSGGGAGGNRGGEDEGGDTRDRRPKVWQVKVTTNRVHKAYYEAQGVFKDEEDEKAFYSKMNEVLPITIRLDGSSPYVKQLREKIRTELSEGLPMEVSEEEQKMANVERVLPPLALPWYPNQNAWRFGVDRRTMRKIKSLAKLKEFLIAEEDTGNIMRQEEASMIPPEFLDVKPEHNVLDMCAAPGSKTAQLLEALHKEDRSRNFAPPSGVVIANDAAANRTHMLMNRMRAMNSPNLIVTCHNAQTFPSVEGIICNHDRAQIKAYRAENGEGFFDRVLADVPCSGDGTMRKSPDIWRTWSPASGLVLHPLQLMIARRGLKVLRVGGLMVYSTCSINPMEDEAVVAEILRGANGAVELVDTTGQLPDLVRRAGKSTWKVAIPEIDATKTAKRNIPAPDEIKPGDDVEGAPENLGIRQFATFEEYEAYAKDHPPSKDVPAAVKSCWPPTEEEAAAFHLDRCMRIMPNDQDTGGFFVAVLRKVKPMHESQTNGAAAAAPEGPSAEVEAPAKEDADVATKEDADAAAKEDADAAAKEDDAEAPKEATKEADAAAHGGNDAEPTQREAQNMRDDDMIRVPDALWDPVVNYFDIDSAFGDASQLFYRAGSGEAGLGSKMNKRRRLAKAQAVERNESKPKNITFLSKSAAQIVHRNTRQKLHIVNGGMLLLKRTEKRKSAEDAYRFTQGALELVLPYVKSRKVEITLEDFAQLIHFSTFKVEAPEAKLVRSRFFGVPIKALSPRLQAHFAEPDNRGAVIAGLTPEDNERFLDTFGKRFALSLWAGLTLHALVNKEELLGIYQYCIGAKLMEPCTQDVEAVLVEHLAEEARNRMDKPNSRNEKVATASEEAKSADDVEAK